MFSPEAGPSRDGPHTDALRIAGIDSYAAGNDLRYIAMRKSALRADPKLLGSVHQPESSSSSLLLLSLELRDTTINEP